MMPSVANYERRQISHTLCTLCTELPIAFSPNLRDVESSYVFESWRLTW
jgi:hypothetical protein